MLDLTCTSLMLMSCTMPKNCKNCVFRAPPTLPARKQSSARAPGVSRDSTAAPQLPPKPGRSSASAASSGKSPAASGGDESSSVVDDDDDDEPGGGKNAEWYEYGCV